MSLSSLDQVIFKEIPNFKKLSKLYLYFKARNIIKREVQNCECLIARTSSIGNIAIKYAKKYKKPYLVEVVGCPFDSLWNYGSLIAKFLAIIAFIKQRNLTKEAPFVLYVTKEFLQRRYPTKGVSIDCSDVFILEAADEIILENRKSVLSSDSKIILGTAAGIDIKYKGHKYVIQAIALLKKKGIICEYQVAGAGSPHYIKKLAEKYGVTNQVKLMGAIPHNQIFSWYDKLHIYIQPSLQEGLPRAVVEAMSRGCPIIASNAGGLPELIDSEYITKKKNYIEIAKKIEKLIRNKEEMELQSKINFNRSKEFTLSMLDKKRNQFLSKFMEYCNNSITVK
jgi:glycosyltransferase involved in cell wall biosynthesis